MLGFSHTAPPAIFVLCLRKEILKDFRRVTQGKTLEAAISWIFNIFLTETQRENRRAMESKGYPLISVQAMDFL